MRTQSDTHNYIILCCYSTGGYQFRYQKANIRPIFAKILKMLVHLVQKLQFNGIPFTVINSIYNYYEPLNVLSYHKVSAQLTTDKAGNNYKGYYLLTYFLHTAQSVLRS